MPSVHRILIADPIHEQAQNLLLARPGFEVAVAAGLNEAELAERITSISHLSTPPSRSREAYGQRLRQTSLESLARCRTARAGLPWRRPRLTSDARFSVLIARAE